MVMNFQQQWMCAPYTKPAQQDFIIQRRYIGPAKAFTHGVYEEYCQWHNHRTYRTEYARQDAFYTITRRQTNSHNRLWEYKIQAE